MTRGRGTASVVASPVLVGAVTTLIVIVSVFLAYNANKGLPFVPTYDLSAVVPSGSNLVEGNEVRVGGFRVGVVDTIDTTTRVIDGKPKSVAIMRMKLDKVVQPLPVDTKVIVRARSALGLKYIQLTPGTSGRTFRAGGTIPIQNSTLPVEFDDLLDTFGPTTRANSQKALEGFGDAFAGRGASLNQAIEGLNPFFTFLTPVMRNLSDPRTRLSSFFKEIGETSAQVAPVARVQAELFANMADTFRAFNECSECLRQTIEKSPPTMDTAIESFRVQRPFLTDFTELSTRLRPAVRVLPDALPKLNSALLVGTPVVRSSRVLNRETENVFNALNDLSSNPNTLLALRDLEDTVGVTKPLLNYVAPYQTVCNYGTYFFTGLQGDVGFEEVNGSAQAALLKNDHPGQDNRIGDFGDRPADVGTDQSVHGSDPIAGPFEVQHTQPYGPAIDAQGNADCQAGQSGYVEGPYNEPGGPYPPDQSGPDFQGGGSHTVNTSNSPGLAGPTFTGVPHLRDVP
jgi:virulence factor Mce-like protein